MAQTLHRCLESFKLPRSVVRQKGEESGGGQIKTRIHRVFRDREELPLVSNLADPITEWLKHRVPAVLAEGEPETSFPEELLYREEEEHRPDGSVVYHKIPVEPLAADVRGRTRREMRRKIKSELLRLAAPRFD